MGGGGCGVGRGPRPAPPWEKEGSGGGGGRFCPPLSHLLGWLHPPRRLVLLMISFVRQTARSPRETQLVWSHLSTALRKRVLVPPRADLLRRACMHLNEANDKTHGWRKSSIQAYLEKHVKQPSNFRSRWPMRRPERRSPRRNAPGRLAREAPAGRRGGQQLLQAPDS